MHIDHLESRSLLTTVNGSDWAVALYSTQSIYVDTNEERQTIEVERGSDVEIGRHLFDNLIGNRLKFTVLSQDAGEAETFSLRRNQNPRGAIRNRVGDARILMISVEGSANILIPDGDYDRLSVSAGGGNDLIRVANDVPLNVTLNGGTGHDIIEGGTRYAEIHGGSGNDLIATYAIWSVIDAGPGDDLIAGGAGDDVISGGGGNDSVIPSDGDDEMNGVEVIT